MATYDSNKVLKKSKVRGISSGQPQAVTATIRLGTSATSQASSVATSDLLRFIPLGENVRPLRVIINSVPVNGTPVLTNPTFAVGVAPYVNSAGSQVTLTRPDGTSYSPITASTTALVSSMVIDADNMAAAAEVKRPVADSVSKYGPYYLTLTPAGAGAFSVAGGDIDLQVTVEFAAEVKADALVYTTYVNQNVNNQT